MKWRIAQILLSTTLLAFILLKIDFQKIIQIFQDVNILFFLTALITSVIAIYINTKKWQIMLSANEIIIPYRVLVKQNFLSIFYSIALIGQLSGELMKAYRVTRGQQNKIKIISSILGDKVSGILVLFITAAVLSFFPPQHDFSSFYPFVLLSIAGAGIIFTSFYVPIDFINAFAGHIRFPKINKFISHLSELIASYQIYGKNKRIFYSMFVISFLYQFLIAISFWLIGESINIHLPFIQYLWIFSLLSISLLIPLSIAGLGIREGSLIFLMGLFNVPAEQALGASLLLFVTTAIMGGVGAIFELTQK